eukprot:361961-Chlamydomonas_euryale.AAC.2
MQGWHLEHAGVAACMQASALPGRARYKQQHLLHYRRVVDWDLFRLQCDGSCFRGGLGFVLAVVALRNTASLHA